MMLAIQTLSLSKSLWPKCVFICFRKTQWRSRYTTLAEAVGDVLSSSNDHISDIVIIPPESGDRDVDSDVEDSNDEQLDQTNLPSDVAGQLEVHHEQSDSDEEETPPVLAKKRQKVDPPKWKKIDRVALPSSPSPLGKVGEEHITKDEFDIFRLFFTDDMISNLVDQTILYAQRDKNNPSFTMTADDMRQFLGLLLVSGYHSLPGENDYWSTAEDLAAPVFVHTMARDKFRSIKRYLHVADNHHLTGSKVAKVAPLYESLTTQFQQFGIFHEHLSIDEEMVPYHGHHSAKMFIRNKPIRFGFKLWMLCSSDGYPYNMQIYCGKQGEDDTTPLGTRVVNHLLACISDPASHVVYFDNFFTSYQLVKDLATRNIRAIGTIRDNRTSHCPLTSTAVMKKHDRGSYDYRSDGQVACVRWNDNSVVTLASNHVVVKPLKSAKRRVKAVKAKEVSQPYVVHKYNKGMGGVDILDRMLSSYRPRLRSKKWWWNLFSNGLNMAVVAAYRFYNYLHPQDTVTHLNFRRTIAVSLLKAQPDRVRLGGPTAPTVNAVRYDGVNHHLASCAQGRCVLCQRNTRLHCIKCSKRLHKHCSDFYHAK